MANRQTISVNISFCPRLPHPILANICTKCRKRTCICEVMRDALSVRFTSETDEWIWTKFGVGVCANSCEATLIFVSSRDLRVVTLCSVEVGRQRFRNITTIKTSKLVLIFVVSVQHNVLLYHLWLSAGPDVR
jgi:hypothetical protein